MTEIQKFQQKERIRACYFKRGGNVDAVAKELGDIDAKLVRKVANEIKIKLDGDIKERVAFLIVSTVWQETLSNLTILGERMTRLAEVAENVVSVCCKTPVYYQAVEDSSEIEMFCTSCRKPAYTFVQQDLEAQKMLNELNDQRIKEREFLTDFAKNMGLVVNETPPAPIIRQQIVQIGGGQVVRGADPAVLQNIDLMQPVDREHLRKTIESAILDDSPEEKTENKSQQEE